MKRRLATTLVTLLMISACGNDRASTEDPPSTTTTLAPTTTTTTRPPATTTSTTPQPPTTSGNELTEIPDVVGLTRDEAAEILLSSGFRYRITTTLTNAADENIVLAATPAGPAEPGTLVTIEVALRSVSTPDVVGLIQSQAAERLLAAGFEFDFDYTATNDTPSGTVLSTAPSGEVPPGARITVEIAYPDLVGLTLDEALALLDAAGIVDQVSEVTVEGVSSPTVVGVKEVTWLDGIGLHVRLEVAVAPLPDIPETTAGWNLEPGDLLVSNLDGVSIVRQGAIAGTPVTEPVTQAVGYASGAILFRRDRDESTIWQVTSDGASASLITVEDARISILEIADIPALSAAPTLLFTGNIVAEDAGFLPFDEVAALPLDGSAAPLPLISGRSEGGIGYAGWLASQDALLLTGGSDGGSFIGLHALIGPAGEGPPEPLPQAPSPRFDEPTDFGTAWVDWPADPPIGCCGHGDDYALIVAAVIPDADRVAYTFTPSEPGSPTDVIVMDATTGNEVVRVQIPFESLERECVPCRRVVSVSARSDRVVISRQSFDGSKPFMLPILVLDVATGSVTELDVAGVATLVR